jgi:hypothetical protein
MVKHDPYEKYSLVQPGKVVTTAVKEAPLNILSGILYSQLGYYALKYYNWKIVKRQQLSGAGGATNFKPRNRK